MEDHRETGPAAHDCSMTGATSPRRNIVAAGGQAAGLEACHYFDLLSLR